MKVTAEDVAGLLASPLPRQVPDHISKAALRGRWSWFTILFGLFFGGVGLLVTAGTLPWRFWDDWRLTTDEAANAAGVVTSASETNFSINDDSVYEYRFEFTTVDGELVTSRCFTTGQRWKPNAPVQVRYLATQPEVACVEEARLSKGGWAVAFVVMFPLVGGGVVGWTVAAAHRTRWLLHQGQVAEAEVVSVNETTTQVNYQSVYRIVLTSPALQGGRPVTVRRVNKADVNLALQRARDRQPVFVLHDPRHPKRVLFPEAWIGP